MPPDTPEEQAEYSQPKFFSDSSEQETLDAAAPEPPPPVEEPPPEPAPEPSAEPEPTPPADSGTPPTRDHTDRALAQTDQLIQYLTQSREPTPEPAPPPPVQPGPMPDPVEDRDGFQKWLESTREVDRHTASQETQAVRQQAEDNDRRTRLWNDFSTSHPQYADHPEVVRAAFLAETNGTGQFQGDGRDVITRVSSRLEEMGKAFGGSAQAAETAPPKPNRTAGVSGGSAQPASARSQPAPKTKSMGDALGKIQAESGFW